MNIRTRPAALAALLALAAIGGSARAQSAPPALEKAPRSLADTYGTTVESYYRIASPEFSPLFSVDIYADFYPSTTAVRRFGDNGLNYFVASPHLPGGALLTYFELDSCDLDDAKDVIATLWDCDYSGECGNAPVKVLSSSDNMTAHACSWVAADISSLGVVVNNYGRELVVALEVQGGITTPFSGVIFGYRLQVAPAPAQPTFSDVPASDPGFQYIEALVRSGITGGCGAGTFCPGAPLTRRQMAIFLSKALGLYLPHY